MAKTSNTFSSATLVAVVAVLLVSQMVVVPVQGRYLPTRRSQDDRMDRIREMLKEIMAQTSQYEYAGAEAGESSPYVGAAGPAARAVFKREIPANYLLPQFGARVGGGAAF